MEFAEGTGPNPEAFEYFFSLMTQPHVLYAKYALWMEGDVMIWTSDLTWIVVHSMPVAGQIVLYNCEAGPHDHGS